MAKNFSIEESKKIAKKLGVRFSEHGLKQFKDGLKVELEHGTDATKAGVNANLTKDNPIKTGKIALAHINESPDYYTDLKKLEKHTDSKKDKLKAIISKNTK
jgi:hypothetical protein